MSSQKPSNAGRPILRRGQYCLCLGGTARGGISESEVVKLTQAFGGRLNVIIKLEEGNLILKDLQKIGVARVSLGAALQFKAMEPDNKQVVKPALTTTSTLRVVTDLEVPCMGAPTIYGRSKNGFPFPFWD